MRIHSISKALVVVLLVMLAIIYYLYEYVDRSYSIYILVPVILGVFLYVFQGPLDHWWREKFPLTIDPKMQLWLSQHFPPYLRYSDAERALFEKRLILYVDARLIQSVGKEIEDEVPYDVKMMVAAHGIHVGLKHTDYLIGDMDRIYLYKHPFPTPLYHHLHSVETHIEDGTIILNLEQLFNAILKPKEYYNIAYHAYVESFIAINKISNLPHTWEKIMLVSRMAPEVIIEQIGLPNVDPSVVHVVCYFCFPEDYKSYAQDEYKIIHSIFGTT